MVLWLTPKRRLSCASSCLRHGTNGLAPLGQPPPFTSLEPKAATLSSARSHPTRPTLLLIQECGKNDAERETAWKGGHSAETVSPPRLAVGSKQASGDTSG